MLSSMLIFSKLVNVDMTTQNQCNQNLLVDNAQYSYCQKAKNALNTKQSQDVNLHNQVILTQNTILQMDAQIQSKLSLMSTTMIDDFQDVFQDFLTIRSDLSETNQKINSFATKVDTKFNESTHQQLIQQNIINNLGVQLDTKLNSVSTQINQINSNTLQVLNQNQQTVLQNLSTVYKYINDFNQTQQLNFNQTKQLLNDMGHQSDTLYSNVVAKIEGSKLETVQQHNAMTGILNTNQNIVLSSFDALSLKIQQLKENVTTNYAQINQSLTNINTNTQITTTAINQAQSSSTTRFNIVDQTLASFQTDSITKLNSIIDSCATQQSMSNQFSTTQTQISNTLNSLQTTITTIVNIKNDVLSQILLAGRSSQKCNQIFPGTSLVNKICQCTYVKSGGQATMYENRCCSYHRGGGSRTPSGNTVCSYNYYCVDGKNFTTSQFYSGSYDCS
ncbi:Hypothetical_protein [Hexamita inflata]|uniref:Hypothetical_protein n=1 Tax=Hexamita inflata TaxID=28002 RepID=A0AA86N8V5_9EUKA|nr:Hypothetical protein HINF_LOCUS2799 [Hexamita inflata]